MGVHHVKETLLLKIFQLGLTEQEIIAYLSAIDFEDVSLVAAYRIALKNKLRIVVRALLTEEAVLNEFRFMITEIPQFLDNEKELFLTLLTPPLKNKNFEEILKVIFGYCNYKQYRKRVGKCLKYYGPNVLNNLYILSRIIDLHRHINSVLNWNHEVELSNELIEVVGPPNIFFSFLKSNYTNSRIFKLLQSFSEEDYRDIVRIMDFVKTIEGEDFEKVLKKCIGDKPTSFCEIHLKLLPILYKLKKSDLWKLDLSQDIKYLQGEKLFEFDISVPQTGKDLLEVGIIQQHCVGSYIQSVISKKCQILTLSQEDKVVYTIELMPKNGSYFIRQFRGYRNFSEFEGTRGEKYRNRLLEMLDENKINQVKREGDK